MIRKVNIWTGSTEQSRKKNATRTKITFSYTLLSPFVGFLETFFASLLFSNPIPGGVKVDSAPG